MPGSGPPVNLHVQPDALPAVRAALEDALTELGVQLTQLSRAGFIPQPWLLDPVSEETRVFYNTTVMEAGDGSLSALFAYQTELTRIARESQGDGGQLQPQRSRRRRTCEAATVSDIRWEGHTHQEIYDLVKPGPGAAVSKPAEDAWKAAEALILRIDERIASAMAGSAAGWQGSAADATRNAMAPLNQWALDAARNAKLTAGAVTGQGLFANYTRENMPEPQTAALEAERAKALTDPTFIFHGLDDLQRLEEQAANDAARAVQLMNSYTDNSEGNRQFWVPAPAPPQVTVVTDPVGPGPGGPGALGVPGPGVPAPALGTGYPRPRGGRCPRPRSSGTDGAGRSAAAGTGRHPAAGCRRTARHHPTRPTRRPGSRTRRAADDTDPTGRRAPAPRTAARSEHARARPGRAPSPNPARRAPGAHTAHRAGAPRAARHRPVRSSHPVPGSSHPGDPEGPRQAASARSCPAHHHAPHHRRAGATSCRQRPGRTRPRRPDPGPRPDRHRPGPATRHPNHGTAGRPPHRRSGSPTGRHRDAAAHRHPARIPRRRGPHVPADGRRHGSRLRAGAPQARLPPRRLRRLHRRPLVPTRGDHTRRQPAGQALIGRDGCQRSA